MAGDDRWISVALSVGLHGIIVLWVIFAAQSGIATSRHGLQLVPIDVEIGPATKPQPPRQRQCETCAPMRHWGKRRLSEFPRRRRNPGWRHSREARGAGEAPAEDNKSGLPPQQATNDVPTPGCLTVSAAKDFIRAEVERRWNFDLKKFGDGGYSVPIHVRITSAGTVLSAEILDNEHSADPIYREIALSARSAVLLSSPFALPAGHYQDVMDMVLDLDPRETLR